MRDQIIQIENLGKRYRIRHQQEGRRYVALRDVIAEKAGSLARSLSGKGIAAQPAQEDFWALRGVSLDIRQGEVVGIIGRNGAGKSTLLKILSRITEPTEGRITLKGRVASLLEVGTGFHPELSGRENIYLNGAILGMHRSEIKSKFDEIVAFADVEKFLDTPVKHFSSGMYMRLAFAVAAHLEPEILVIDEVLSVGDAEFQKKCLGRMSAVAAGGRTVLFVSHNMNIVERLCSRVLHLADGKVQGIHEDARAGVMSYLKATFDTNPSSWRSRGGEHANRYFRPLSFDIRSKAPNAQIGEPFSNAHPMTISVCFEVLEEDPAFNIGVAVYDDQGNDLFWSFIKDVAEADWPGLGAGSANFSVQIPPRWLNEGSYRVELLAGLHCRGWFLEPAVNAPSISFEIQGGLSDSPIWNFRRPGLWGPVLKWDRA